MLALVFTILSRTQFNENLISFRGPHQPISLLGPNFDRKKGKRAPSKVLRAREEYEDTSSTTHPRSQVRSSLSLALCYSSGARQTHSNFFPRYIVYGKRSLEHGGESGRARNFLAVSQPWTPTRESRQVYAWQLIALEALNSVIFLLTIVDRLLLPLKNEFFFFN